MFEDVYKKLLNRPAKSHKYDFGHVLVVGGSAGMVGAPFLAAKAALRIGAGLVTIASTADVVDKLEKRVEEIMTLRIEDENLEDFIKQRKVNSLLIGPGMKQSLSNLVLELLQSTKLPAVIDGGALPLAKRLNKLSIPKILTPHTGEFGRLIGHKLPSNEEALQKLATSFAKSQDVILVLKGHPTYVASADSKIYINQTGGPALATAGTGDVLAGMIGGLIAQGIGQFEAAKAAVYLHGKAGHLAAKQKTEIGIIASDVIEAIPLALKAES